MVGSTRSRLAVLAATTAALLVTAAPAAAAAPTVETWTVHVERPFVDCPDFSVVGIWDISHRLTLFVDTNGTPIRDIERVDFRGRLVNTSTGGSVADSGSRIFFDTLAPDGSYLATYGVQVRHSEYIHTAGRTDFQTGVFHGRDGMGAGSIAALCDALGS